MCEESCVYSGEDNHEWERFVERVGRSASYPSSPDVSGQVLVSLRTTRSGSYALRVAGVLGILSGVFIALLVAPDMRAGVFDVIRLGAIRIINDSSAAETPEVSPDMRITPIISLFEGATETTLEDARRRFDVFLPAYPPGLGLPDYVLAQGEFSAIFIWADSQDRNKPYLILQSLLPQQLGAKFFPYTGTEVTVRGNQGFWLDHPHIFRFFLPEEQEAVEREVAQNVLVWTENNITFRLETDLSLDEALRIAGSLRK